MYNAYQDLTKLTNLTKDVKTKFITWIHWSWRQVRASNAEKDQLGHAELAAFAMDYLIIPAFTAQLERLFSNCAYVHTDVRNRLCEETSKKLANIYFTLRSVDQVDDDDFE